MIVPGNRPIVVLRIDKLRSLPKFLLKMREIYSNMTSEPSMYPDPRPTLAEFKTNINLLEAAMASVETRTRGNTEARQMAYNRVLNNVQNLRNYVQTLVNEQEDLNVAKVLIEKSGFEEKNKRNYIKSDFYGKLGPNSGEIRLYVKAADRVRASYRWDISEDSINWKEIDITIKATVLIKGLTPGNTYYFRYRSTTVKGHSDWSAIKMYIII